MELVKRVLVWLLFAILAVVLIGAVLDCFVNGACGGLF